MMTIHCAVHDGLIYAVNGTGAGKVVLSGHKC